MASRLNGTIRTVVTLIMSALAIASMAYAVGQGSAKKAIPQIERSMRRMERRLGEEEKISAVIGVTLTRIDANIKEIKEKMP